MTCSPGARKQACDPGSAPCSVAGVSSRYPLRVVGYVSAGMFAAGAVGRLLGFRWMQASARTASTVQRLTDGTQVYRLASLWLIVLCGGAAVLMAVVGAALAADRRQSRWSHWYRRWLLGVAVAALYAVWQWWQGWPAPATGGQVLIAGNATPTPAEITLVMDGADSPFVHAGVFGTIVACAVAGTFAVLVWTADDA